MTRTVSVGEQTYRRAYLGLWIGAGILFGSLIGFGERLPAVAAFFLLAGAAVGLRATYDGPLFDERDEHIHYRASGHTITLIGVLSALIFPRWSPSTSWGFTNGERSPRQLPGGWGFST